MKTPKRLETLVQDGLIDRVLSRLMSGKEADIYIVESEGRIRCAKVYKEAVNRSFKKAAQYQEGRKVRSGRRARAMEKGSKFGRKQQENVWQTAEVNALQRLQMAGVRVPQTYGCVEGVLLMELIVGADGDVAPQLAETRPSADQAFDDFILMMHYLKLMLVEGMVHGDLSEFNVLVDPHGPVIIDLPQAVDAAANNNARAMFRRDVNNMRRYYGNYSPAIYKTDYANEMWDLFESGELTPESPLTGFPTKAAVRSANVGAILKDISAVKREEQERLARLRDGQDG